MTGSFIIFPSREQAEASATVTRELGLFCKVVAIPNDTIPAFPHVGGWTVVYDRVAAEKFANETNGAFTDCAYCGRVLPGTGTMAAGVCDHCFDLVAVGVLKDRLPKT